MKDNMKNNNVENFLCEFLDNKSITKLDITEKDELLKINTRKDEDLDKGLYSLSKNVSIDINDIMNDFIENTTENKEALFLDWLEDNKNDYDIRYIDFRIQSEFDKFNGNSSNIEGVINGYVLYHGDIIAKL